MDKGVAIILIIVGIILLVTYTFLYNIYRELKSFIKDNQQILDTVKSLSDVDQITSLMASVNNISANMPSKEEIDSVADSINTVSANMPSKEEIDSVADSINTVSENMPSKQEITDITDKIDDLETAVKNIKIKF